MTLHITHYLTPADHSIECIEDCSASGDVSSAVTYWRDKLNFTVDRTRAIAYLVSSGGWEDDELERETDTWLALRILWLACCSFNEGDDYFYLGE